MASQQRRALLRSASLLVLVAVASPLMSCREGRPASAGPAPSSARGRRVLLVGLDGADWSLIDPLVAAGRLPTFARLKAAGHAATLVATPPLVSPILWTTIATGRHPEEHGVLDFMVDVPGGGQRPVGSVHRKTPALWSLFSAAGRPVAVVGWWATWPPENVQGTIVSDRLAPQLTRPERGLAGSLISPPDAAHWLLPLLARPEQIGTEDLRRFLPVTDQEHRAALERALAAPTRFYGDRLAHLAAVLAGTHTYDAMSERLLQDRKPAFTAVYLEAIDTVSHLFVKDGTRGRRAIEQAYVETDGVLSRLAAAAAPDTWVIVCSDHGFHQPDAGLSEDPAELRGPATAWHRPYGMAAAAEARQLTAPRTASPAAAAMRVVTPLDIAPTVLHAAGLPVDSAMPGRVAAELLPSDRAAAAPTRQAYGLPAVASASDSRSAAIDEAALARLQALGYVGSRPSSQAMQNLGESLYRRRRYDAAERALRSAVESQPQNLGAWLWLARTLESLGRRREALNAWGEALRLPDGPAAALLPAVEAAVAEGRAPEAVRLIAASRGAPQAAMLTARAIVAFGTARPAEAERHLREALRADPTFFDALFRLFDHSHRAGRAKDALAPVERAARALPGSVRHAALLGEVLLATGDLAQAERTLARALEQAPDSGPVRLDLARAQLARQRAADARTTLGPAAPSAERSILLGAAYAAEARWSEAAAQYREALSAGARTPELLNGLGWALHKQGRNREAADALRQSLAMRADQPQIRQLLGTLGP